MSAIANELLAATRAPTTDVTNAAESELSLRRQLSRLQRQLSESQRELANKDDELASEVEKRMQITEAAEAQHALMGQLQSRLDEYVAWAEKVQGIDVRLQESIAVSDELVQQNERERAATATALAKVDELNKSFEETRALWNAERAMLEERMTNEIATLDGLRKAAVDASAEALNAQAARLREAHEAAAVELRSTHEQSLATLRGDLEPKALQAHSLAEERERLLAELATVRNDAIRETVEREEDFKQDLAQAIEAKDSEIATLVRNHAAELSRAIGERDEKIISLQQGVKAAETQNLTLEGEVEAVRSTLKTAQRETSEAKEKFASSEVEKKQIIEQLALARSTIDKLHAEKRQLAEQIEAAQAEVRRGIDERRRFVAYLEEGLALLGALPPAEQIIEMEPDDGPD